jgi:glycosyltransferase involved in cell wall biosynthesis
MYHGIDACMNQERALPRQKVLFVVTKSNFGGAQRYVYDLSRELDKGLFEAVVAAGPGQGSKSAGSLIKRLDEAGIRTVFVPELTRDVGIADFGASLALYRLFRKERPDIVHLNSSKAGGLGALAARLTRIRRIVFTSHGLSYDEPRSLLAKGVIFFFTWLTFLLSHAVVCVSQDTARRAAKLPFCGTRVRLIYNGIEPPDYLSNADARAELLKRTDPVAPDALWLGTIAELVPNKGIGYALRACEEVKRSGRSFVFFIIGSGDQEKLLAEAVQKRGLAREVRLLGYVPDAARLLKAFDVFALTSRKEGLPYVLLEAGRTDIPGIRDIVENGRSGALANPSDPQQFADALCELIDDGELRARFADALKARVIREFDLRRMVRETEALY